MKRFPFALLLAVIALVSTGSLSAQKREELAPTPPMGWNSWNWWGKQAINEDLIRETIDAIAEEGLRDAGYTYVVIDGGWRDTQLGPSGELLPHPTKFPHGIKALADHAHAKGLKLGVHIVPGTHDCGGDPVGGFGLEETHVQQMVDWGIDFIKLDQCKNKDDPCETCDKLKSGWSEATIEASYRKWSELLHDCGRDIVFSISGYKFRDWYPEVCNMARTTRDIQARCTPGGAMFNPLSSVKKRFLSVMEIAGINHRSADAAGNGYWNDPDMMVTGEQGMSEDEQTSHFALWCMMSSPLFLGNDPRNMTAFEKALIKNPELIAINQDTSGQGRLFHSDESTQIWVKKLSGQRVAVMMLNLHRSETRPITFELKEIGIREASKVRDALNREELNPGQSSLSATLATNQCRVFVLSL